MEDYLLICWKIIPKWLRMICIWFCLVYTFFKARPRSWPIDTSFWRDIGDTKSTNQHRKCNPEIFAGQKKANVYRGRQKHWCHKRTLVDSILERWFPDHEIEEEILRRRANGSVVSLQVCRPHFCSFSVSSAASWGQWWLRYTEWCFMFRRMILLRVANRNSVSR